MSKRIETKPYRPIAKRESTKRTIFYGGIGDVIAASITTTELRGAKFGWLLFVFSHIVARSPVPRGPVELLNKSTAIICLIGKKYSIFNIFYQ